MVLSQGFITLRAEGDVGGDVLGLIFRYDRVALADRAGLD